ncbi:hypothetical protein [uncultured Roseivirga sp.]|uniref:hypothetical protein n=1 Tax=uncultured Roseivirga sp. TaxID=543088 RepID=UPI0030DAB3A1|tara:strand:- start:1640 stop:1909 length:270 start_codon:yes stop_codon:yes gene_type:complete
MSNETENGTGFFEGLLMVVGGISGAVFGYNAGEIIGLFIGAIIFGAIGKWVGQAADTAVKLLLLVAFLMINAAIRRFIWSIISAILGLN